MFALEPSFLFPARGMCCLNWKLSQEVRVLSSMHCLTFQCQVIKMNLAFPGQNTLFWDKTEPSLGLQHVYNSTDKGTLEH